MGSSLAWRPAGYVPKGGLFGYGHDLTIDHLQFLGKHVESALEREKKDKSFQQHDTSADDDNFVSVSELQQAWLQSKGRVRFHSSHHEPAGRVHRGIGRAWKSSVCVYVQIVDLKTLLIFSRHHTFSPVNTALHGRSSPTRKKEKKKIMRRDHT